MSIIQNQSIARPYAVAAFRFAKAQKSVDSWQAFLNSASKIFSAKKMQSVLTNPFIDQMQLVGMLVESFQKNFSKEQINFLQLLAECRRLAFLNVVAEQFQKLQEQDAGVLSVTVSSAFDLDKEVLEKLQKKLTAKFQKTISMTAQINAELIGGVHIQAGDQVLDASVKGMLMQLGQDLLKI